MLRASRLIALVAILILGCNRATPPQPAAHAPTQRRVLFVGLDGADWRMLDPLMKEGAMPNLAGLVRDGDRRVLLTQHPPLSPLLWTTMMTGVSPLEHRILDFTRVSPTTRIKEPITSDERAVPALWNMTSAQGKRVGVFGLWATDPPEEVNGMVVSDRQLGAQISIPESPARVEAATNLVQRLSTEWIRTNKPDLAIIYFQGTDEIGHLLAGDTDAARPYFQRIDSIIGELQQLATELDADLVLASDHGFDWGGKHDLSSTAVATAGKWHRDEGIFLHWSPRKKISAAESPGRIDQIAGTVLALMGLPHDDRIAKPIDGVASPSRTRIDYRRRFRRQKPAAQRPQANDEAVARLKALGYIGGSEPLRAPSAASSTRTAASFNNEGLILQDLRKPEEAQSAYLGALDIDPAYAPALWNLSSLLHTQKIDESRSRTLLIAAFRAGLPDGNEQLIRRAREYAGSGDGLAAIALLSEGLSIRAGPDLLLHRGRYLLESHDCRKARDDFRSAAAADPRRADVHALLGTAEACLGNSSNAAVAIRRSLELDADQPQLREFLRSLP